MSAPPTLNPPVQHGEISSGGTTIEAKPQLKNLIGDATRFVPTSLKVRRTVKDAQGRLIQIGGGVSSSSNRSTSAFSAARKPRLIALPNSVLFDLWIFSLLSEKFGSIPGGALGVTGPTVPSTKTTTTNKDAAYEEFMREMEGLL